MSLVFIDTNVLIYSISTDASEIAKRDRAREILDRDDGALSVQVLQEFYVQATRPTRQGALSDELAAGFIRTWRRFKTQETSLALVEKALAIRMAHRFSYWDCAIIAAALTLGCSELLSEDMAHDREIETVRIVNPFR